MTRGAVIRLFGMICLGAVLAWPWQRRRPTRTGLTQRPFKRTSSRWRGAGVGEVYMLRGFADVFSRGLDAMAETLAARGIDAKVVSHTAWRRVLRAILDDRQRCGPRPIVLIGHSLGANAVIDIAEELKQPRHRRPVRRHLAATGPDPVPSNVRRIDNFYFATHGWGEPLVPGPGFSGSLRNLRLLRRVRCRAFQHRQAAEIQREVLANILRYVQP